MATFTDNLIAELDSQIDDLTKVINTLGEEREPLLRAKEALLEGKAADTPEEDKSKTTKKSSKGKSTKGGAPTDPDELHAWRLANLKKAREARAAKAKGTKTRAQEILDLLDDGLTAAEVAEELGISKGYVYNTKNRADHAAA